MTQTAEQFRAEAAAHRAEAEASFDRCDTDGFLSQWASGINARLADTKAELAEAGNQAIFQRTVLQTPEGEAVDFTVCQTRFGTKYRVEDALSGAVQWLAYQPARESTLAKKGFREVTETEVAEARAKLDAPAGSIGTGGASNVFVRIYRPDAKKSDGWVYRDAATADNLEAYAEDLA